MMHGASDGGGTGASAARPLKWHQPAGRKAEVCAVLKANQGDETVFLPWSWDRCPGLGGSGGLKQILSMSVPQFPPLQISGF
jgi:hypothetical protein